jgi:simple sugar transport system permease protein
MLEDLLQVAIVINILAATVRIATPLLLASMGELIAERSGVMNMGLEGTMLTAAFVGFLVAEKTGSLWLAVCMAALAGGAMSFILAFMAITLRVDQVITGLALNLLAAGGTLFFFRLIYTQYDTAGTPLIDAMAVTEIPFLSRIPYLGEILFSHNLLTYLAFLLVPIVWFFLNRTRYGLQIRSLGENPRAADLGGISVFRLRYLAVIAGGLLAGLAGAFVSVGSVERFFPEMTAGRGWLAIVIVIAGNWRPGRIFMAALFFAFLDAFQVQVQGIGVKIPYQLLLALPFILAIVAMILGRTRSKEPGALGVPYSRDG